MNSVIQLYTKHPMANNLLSQSINYHFSSKKNFEKLEIYYIP